MAWKQGSVAICLRPSTKVFKFDVSVHSFYATVVTLPSAVTFDGIQCVHLVIGLNQIYICLNIDVKSFIIVFNDL